MRKLINPRALMLAALLVTAAGFIVMPHASAQEPTSTVTYEVVFWDADRNPAPLIEGISGAVITVDVGVGEGDVDAGDLDCNDKVQHLDVIALWLRVVDLAALSGCTGGPVSATIVRVDMPDYGLTRVDLDAERPGHARIMFTDARKKIEPGMDLTPIATVVLKLSGPGSVPMSVSCDCEDDQGDPIDWPLQVVLVR